MSTRMSAQPEMVRGLMKPKAYPHRCSEIKLVETHISWVFLTGDFAYKLKKPLDLGFLNFSELKQREFYCHEELRLNSRTAPEIYLEVVPVCGSPKEPRVHGEGEAFEYAVRMKQFCETGLLDRQLREGTLGAPRVISLAEKVADLHAKIAVSTEEDPYGTPDSVRRWALENFQQLEAKLQHPDRLERLAGLKRWTQNWLEEQTELLAARKQGGFVRECHGDLHLGNVTEVEGEVLLFDGIEFNDEIRWIDVINEMAFLFSDFEHRDAASLGWTALNRYLEITGDYQEGLDQAEREELEQEVDVYLEQGERVTAGGTPTFVLMRGLSGSGKSFISSRLIGELQAVRLRSDIERKRLFGVEELASSGSGVSEGIYTPEAGRKTFDRLSDLARTILGASYHTVVDATFLRPDLLNRFRELGEELGISVKVLDVRAPEPVLRSRLVERNRSGKDASEADLSVLKTQLKDYRFAEGEDVISVDGESPPTPRELTAMILERG